MARSVDDLIPLNVKTYGQGFLKLQGWMVFSALAFLTGGLLVAYELLVVNVEDQDFRDMLLDYRLTYDGVRYQHKHFVNAQYCCHSDSAVLSYNCKVDPVVGEVFGADGPQCPPVIQFTCPNLASSNCNHVRQLLYATVGLDTFGQPVDCNRTGHVLLAAKAGPGYKLTAHHGGQLLTQQMTFNPLSVTAQQIQDYVNDVVNEHAAPYFKVPSTPLNRAVHVNGQQLLLAGHLEAPTGDKWGTFGWPSELWPWPPGAACSKTGTPAALWLEGDHKLTFRPFINSTEKPQPTVTVALYQSTLSIPQYKLIQSNDGLISVQVLSEICLTVGMLAQLDGCEAWQLLKPSTAVQYDKVVWTGTPEQMQALKRPVIAGTQTITISLHDVSQPTPLALPKYNGELYVYVALVLGGLWMFATLPLIIMLGVLVLNVQRNRGLPIFFYKYMRQYRGW